MNPSGTGIKPTEEAGDSQSSLPMISHFRVILDNGPPVSSFSETPSETAINVVNTEAENPDGGDRNQSSQTGYEDQGSVASGTASVGEVTFESNEDGNASSPAEARRARGRPPKKGKVMTQHVAATLTFSTDTTAAVGMGTASTRKTSQMSQQHHGDVHPRGSNAGQPTNRPGPYYHGHSLAASQNPGPHLSIHHRPVTMVGQDLRQQPQRYSYSEQQNGPLEQLNSGIRRSTESPTQNMVVYTQLIAPPHKQSGCESGELTQEKRMQFPNPIQGDFSGRMDRQVQEFNANFQQNIRAENQQEVATTSAFPSGAPDNNNSKPQFPFAPTGPGMPDPNLVEVRNGVRTKANNQDESMTCDVGRMHNFFLHGGQGPVRARYQARSRTSSSPSVPHLLDHVQKLHSKFDEALFERKELQIEIRHLRKRNKLAAARLLCLSSQLEEVRTNVQMQQSDKKF